MRLTSPGLLDILAKELPNIVNDLKQQIANLSPAKRRLLEQKLTEYTAGRSPTIFKNRDDAEPTPLSYNQQRLWFVHQLLPEAPLFNQVNLFQIHGHLDIIALRKALHAFIERHDTLRTTFHIQDDGQLVQIVSQQWSLGLPVIRLNNTKDSINDLRRLAQTEGGKPFDLSQDLLMRGIVYEFDKNNYALFLLHHHISSDYWSKGILNQELSALYSAELAGQSPSLEPLPIRYADFAYWQREQAANSNLDERLANWRQALPDPLPVLSLPTNQQQSPDTSHTIFNYESLLSEHLLSDLSELARSANVTLFMSILAAYSVLLYRYFRDNEFIVGTILSGRGRRILEPLFGNFINLLPIPISVNDSQSFLTLLQQVREKAINAYAHQDLPFEKLVGELQPERDLNRAPVFQTYLNFLNSPSGDLQLEGLDSIGFPWTLNMASMIFI